MEVKQVFNDLYMFNSFMPQIDLSFNQYLLAGKEPLLVHTGSKPFAADLVVELKKILKDRTLRYIFISHFESDECGGLGLILTHFPDATAICSAVTARQLSGFGLSDKVIVKGPGDPLQLGENQLQFIKYPSEMHLWEGLLALETKRGILFSSDLFIRRGRVQEAVIDADWEKEVKGITVEQIPGTAAREELQNNLLTHAVHFVAPGHGPCLRLSS